jgi:predicted ArsR family transcriptional regulator
MERDRVTIQEAARRLGISESGVRKRVKRRQLDSTNEGGRVFVYLDSVVTEADPVPDSVPDKYTASLEDQVEFLRDQVRRQQEIIGQQAVTMRQLSAPAEPDEPTTVDQDEDQETYGPGPEGPATPDSEATGEGNVDRRGWWRRIWGG